MKRWIISLLLLVLSLALSYAGAPAVKGVAPPDQASQRKEVKFQFAQKSSRAVLDQALRARLAVAEKLPSKAKRVTLKALPLDNAGIGLLSGVTGKKFTAGKIQQSKITGEQLAGTFYTAALAYIHTMREKKYQDTLKTLKPQDQAALTAKWKKYTASMVQHFRDGGLSSVTEQQLETMGQQLTKNTELYTNIGRVMGQAKRQQASAGTSVRPQSINLGTPSVGVTVTHPINTAGNATDLCSKPLSASLKAHYGFTQNITLDDMPCLDWEDLFGDVCFCCSLTVASIDVSLDISYGYTVNCEGGTGWATGDFDASTTVPVVGTIGVHFDVEATGVAEVGKATEGNSCVYNFALSTQICGSFLGQDVCLSGPTEGFSVTAPCPKTPVAPPNTWTINEPNVKSKTPIVYDGVHGSPKILFQAGDIVEITAGGCVQTGGSGKTWKRFVNPSGDNSDKRYYGTIEIAGLTKGLVPIRSIPGQYDANQKDVYTIHFPTAFPSGLPAQQCYLTVGYVDDNYGDNGYYSHDNGTQDQCKGCNNAWIKVTVIHGKP